MPVTVKPGKYMHFEGNEYEVTASATNSETLEEMVIYRPSGGSELWVCPASVWVGTVDHFGQTIKRFTRLDEVAAEASIQIPPGGINKYNNSAEKVKLFLSLFTGREDVFAKRYDSAKSGKSGYVPACYIEWSPQYPRSGGGKVKCSECPNHRFIPFDSGVVENHLTGRLTAGAYPMLPDETCRFLAFDFDGKEYSPDDLRRDVSAIREACIEKVISMAVERSRSGTGIHFWIFFASNIPVKTARKFGSSLITYAMNNHHELSFKTYDRMIPNQDTTPKGRFGSLIALPLQKVPRKNKNSEFVDENFTAYADQWAYLSNIRKYALEEDRY
ncbi:MAG: DUF1653 domain-containing protein [Clostridiales bacterium]|jgi:hypothetical protein|nr:DUF1653 domain-containing protein [Clostridiales bacterium]